MTESDYLKWVKAGKPKSWDTKSDLMVEWWLTDPSFRQRRIVRRMKDRLLGLGLMMGLALGSAFILILNQIFI